MSFRARLVARLLGPFQPRPPRDAPLVLVVVEGPHDIEFPQRIGAILHGEDPRLPDLAGMERRGHLVFLPVGGGNLGLWTTRLAPLGLPEFHLYDRESAPETELRRKAAEIVNLRPRCRAVLTGKRCLENYLHPAAIREATGIEVQFSDDDPLAELIGQRLYHTPESGRRWEELPPRTKARRRNRIKRWLHTKAVDRMTPQRLAERDPQGEVVAWLKIIAGLASESPPISAS